MFYCYISCGILVIEDFSDCFEVPWTQPIMQWLENKNRSKGIFISRWHENYNDVLSCLDKEEEEVINIFPNSEGKGWHTVTCVVSK